MAKLDQEFYEALVAKGFDVSQLGLIPGEEGALEKAFAPGNKAVNPVAQEKGLEKNDGIEKHEGDVVDEKDGRELQE